MEIGFCRQSSAPCARSFRRGRNRPFSRFSPAPPGCRGLSRRGGRSRRHPAGPACSLPRVGRMPPGKGGGILTRRKKRKNRKRRDKGSEERRPIGSPQSRAARSRSGDPPAFPNIGGGIGPFVRPAAALAKPASGGRFPFSGFCSPLSIQKPYIYNQKGFAL